MLCVCDVHCSAANKVLMNEMDWYGILQIELTADEALIKKQYRKFALLLHPDKNKFAGAEAAFKLIGEAQRVLLDKDKRTFYDMKRRTSFKPMVQAGKNVSARRQSNSHVGAVSSAAQRQQQPAQSEVPNGRETFWTLCPFCAVRYQYYKEVLNRALRCQSCKKPFIAYDMCAQGFPPGTNATHPPFSQPEVSNQGTGHGSYGPKNPTGESFPRAGYSAEVGNSQKTSDLNKGAFKANKEGCFGGPKPSRKVNGKRGKKQVEESSESCDSGSTDSEGGVGNDPDGDILSPSFKMDGNSQPRRSTRNKRHISYNENVSDDDEVLNPSKQPKASHENDNSDASLKEEPSNPTETFEEIGERGTNENGKGPLEDNIRKSFEADHVSMSDSSSKAAGEPEIYECPDPDFSNFDLGRKEDCFFLGQIWSIYDTIDAMPRFYARIQKVFKPRFKLRITWLEPDPDVDDKIERVNRDLPFSCGKFKYGGTEITKDRLMFSQPMSWEKGSGRDSFKIYPKKGETWALFKNWDTKWNSSPESKRKYEYDFVEVLSDYDLNVGIRVAYLGKLKGFSSLFYRRHEDELQIPLSDLAMFSHKVPSCKMSGEERNDVPPGSFELDPASISMNLEEITLPKEVKIRDKGICFDGSSSKLSGAHNAVEEVEGRASTLREARKDFRIETINTLDDDSNDANDQAVTGAFPPEAYEIPDPEFFNFDGMKSLDKFQVGQIWALYSDVDGLPKYYALIKKIDPPPDLKLHVSWLEACLLPTDMIVWQDKEMPICCGGFKIKSGRPQPYIDSSSFSHQLQTQPTSRKNIFVIYPQKGEVWAVYKNWNAKMTSADLANCEYMIVEVLDVNNSRFKGSVLERVPGFNSVFKTRMAGKLPITVDILRAELLKFSNLIPSFRLTEEKGGRLRGYWELDPAALPYSLLHPN
ncbi:hypothetical protein Nepgr_030290 [Nepenthes gracilis]|uniref:J domain-containing protein n=1 Tax=Nepenthes gracilis TaxID=150966 RepID=A0AAD3TFH6_NEPGR|nr:hypothetical protein Nepgr_030290 [Nepenthes gracilis]